MEHYLRLSLPAELWDVAAKQKVSSSANNTAYGEYIFFSPDGKFIATIGANGNWVIWEINAPANAKISSTPPSLGRASTSGTVATGTGNSVTATGTSGKVLLVFGAEGTGSGQFSAPRYIKVDKQGNIYVGETYNFRVQKFDSKGNFFYCRCRI